jgi:ferric-dicitrate binding protein FerR (iron transport regulator)
VFNIKAYTEDKSIETTLLSGKAEILKSSGQSITMLSPGEQAEYEKEGRVMKISPVNVEFVTGWKDGKFVFREKRLEEICRDLQNWYDVKFEIRNDALKEFKYSGTIKRTTTVGYVLKMLKVTTNINYEIVNKPVGPDLVIIN